MKRMLTRHGDEIVEEHIKEDWDLFREEVTCLDVTPCRKWIDGREESFSDFRDDFGSVRLPWEHTWAEYYVGANGIDRVGIDMLGLAVEEYDLEDPESPYAQALKKHMGRELFVRLYRNEEVSYSVSAPIFLDLGKRKWIYEGTVLLFLDEHGLLVQSQSRRFFSMPDEKLVDRMETVEHARSLLIWRLVPVLFGLGLAHCPNVVIYEDEKPEPVRKKRIKSGKNPGQTFKCLDIEAFKEEVRRTASDGETEGERARHLVRGHFKHYSEDAPLFGHTTGNIWCPPHERGSEDAGRVDKQYRSQAPNQDDDSDG